MARDPSREERVRSAVFGAHALLAALWIGWRVLEGTPATASALGGPFAESVPGRATALVTLLVGVASLVTILALSLPRWRDVRLSGLLAALVGALALRKGVDALDFVYVGLAAMVCVAWFDGRRRRAAMP